MVFDLAILLLCTYRLVSHRASNLGHILLRDGIVSLKICTHSIQLTRNLSAVVLLLRIRCQLDPNYHGRTAAQPSHEHHHPSIRLRCVSHRSHHGFQKRLHCVRRILTRREYAKQQA